MNIDNDDSKCLCSDCIDDPFLSNLVFEQGTERMCDYCEDEGLTLPIVEIADFVEQAFDQHYVRTSTEPDSWQMALMADKESDYEWQRSGEEVVDAIERAAGIPQEAAADIQEILNDRHFDFDLATMGEETEFSGDSYYESKSVSDDIWKTEWHNFEKLLKTEARFFSRTGAKFLTDLFSDIDKKETHDRNPIIVPAGPDTELTSIYRARVFQSLDDLEEALRHPDQHLGPPPSNLAKAGRMNAHGISVFYGANNPSIALAEVRPPVGSRVTVAKFDIVRPIQLLDITSLEDVYESGSIFDPNYAKLLAKSKFLGTLKEHMTRAVLPNDEITEYLSTQAVADFLATESKIPVDGIIYPSTQAGKSENKYNVVLFRKASIVEKIRYAKGVDIHVSLGSCDEDGEWSDDSSVIVTKPAISKSESLTESKSEPIDSFTTLPFDYDEFQELFAIPTLKIDLNSIEIHHIQNIQVISNQSQVGWYETTDDLNDF